MLTQMYTCQGSRDLKKNIDHKASIRSFLGKNVCRIIIMNYGILKRNSDAIVAKLENAIALMLI
jgi:hypothetical protein